MLVHPVTLAQDIERIEILPLSDLHVGDPAFDEPAFKRYVKYISDAPNRYAVLNGDIINNALKSSVSDVYSEIMPPRRQVEHAYKLLEPVSDRILGIVSGNHERRTDRESGISPIELLAEKLHAPYFGVEVLLKIQFGWSHKNRAMIYTMYVTHGWGGGRLRGGKVNNLERLKNVVICDVYCMAHTHGMVAFPSTVYIPHVRQNVVSERKLWFVNSGSFLNRGDGYAAAKGYEPQVLGCPIIELEGYQRNVTVIQGRI
jgi:predicted phosphodiesterase